MIENATSLWKVMFLSASCQAMSSHGMKQDFVPNCIMPFRGVCRASEMSVRHTARVISAYPAAIRS